VYVRVCIHVCVCTCANVYACSYRAVTGVDQKSFSRPPCFLRDINRMQQVRMSGRDRGLEMFNTASADLYTRTS